MRLLFSFSLLASMGLGLACSAPSPGGAGGAGGGGAADPPATDWVVHDVRVDSVGYATGRTKVATVVLPAGMTALSDTTAEVFDLERESGVGLRGHRPLHRQRTSASPTTSPTSRRSTAPGRSTSPCRRSARTRRRSRRRSRSAPTCSPARSPSAMTGMYGQRCGTAVKITMGSDTWQHGACHQHDADSLEYLTGVDKPFASTGGWHDAGDYGKYVNNGAFSVGMLLARLGALSADAGGAVAADPGARQGRGRRRGAAAGFSLGGEVGARLVAHRAERQRRRRPARQADRAGVRALRDVARVRRPEALLLGVGTAMTANFVAVMAAGGAHLSGRRADGRRQVSGRRAARLRLSRRQRRPGGGGQRRSRRWRPTSSRPGTTSRPTPTIDCGRRPRCGRRRAIRRRWPTSRRARPVRRWRPTSTGRTSPTWASSRICCRSARTRALRESGGRWRRSRPALTTAADSLVTDRQHATPSGARSATTSTGGRTARWRARRCCSGWPTRSAPTTSTRTHDPDAARLPAGAELLRSVPGHDGRLPPACEPHHGPSTGDGVRDPWPGLLVGGADSTASMITPGV